MKKQNGRITRRTFLGGTAASAAAFSFLPGRALGREGAPSPNSKLNIAAVGVGGRGLANLHDLRDENIVALCDVDQERAAKAYEQFPNARRFRDFRRMLEQMDKEVDAVVVSTPDHAHAVACMMAIRMGKHVYCEKPLAHSVYEVREIVKAARKHKVATQLGNQGHSAEDIRRFCEWIWDGAIGKVREVHAICGSSYSRIGRLDAIKEAVPAPPTLDWDLWLGPAPYRPYHPEYVPGKWRSWMAFGTGAIGDWVCHVVDPVFWALNLGHPTSVEAETGDYDPEKHGETFPRASTVRYEFPARGDLPPVKLTWYEGASEPPRPEELEPDQKVTDMGAIVIGDKGKIMYGSHGAGGARIIPRAKMKEYKPPPRTIPRSAGHHVEWVAACKGGKPAGSNFDYGGPLTEIALLGIIAMRCKGRRLLWSAEKMEFTNDKEANRYLHFPYRKGWTL